MQEGRTIFIGDIHGCYKEFKLLLNKINLKEEDKVYLTGDLINKGPKSYKVIKYIYKNQDQFKVVLGNNELNFLNWLNNGVFINNTIEYKKLKDKLKNKENILNFLKNIPLYIENDNFLLIHAGLIPGKELKSHSPREITSIREYDNKPWYEYYTGNKKIIYGHRGLDGLRIRKNTIGLDTGCVYGSRLTAYILETGEIIQQSAQNIYINVYKNEN